MKFPTDYSIRAAVWHFGIRAAVKVSGKLEGHASCIRTIYLMFGHFEPVWMADDAILLTNCQLPLTNITIMLKVLNTSSYIEIVCNLQKMVSVVNGTPLHKGRVRSGPRDLLTKAFSKKS